jgi:hypothetical protein
MSKAVSRWIIRLFLAGLLLSASGCQLPFPGPYIGVVLDAKTDEPIEGALVRAEWWCHDNPLPDGPGSFFIRVETSTDAKGAFRIDKQRRRGGLFGSSFALKVEKPGYIPANIIALEHGNELPESTKEYPLIASQSVERFPDRLRVKLSPAVPVLLKAMESGIPLYQRTAREELIKLLGIDCQYDPEKWKKAADGHKDEASCQLLKERAREQRECPCPEATDRSGQPRDVRKKVREFVNAGLTGDIEKVRRFLQNGMDPNVQNYACRTVLMRAAGHGHVELVKLLISAGAKADLRDDNCSTALIKAAGRYGNAEVVRILLSQGADVNAQDNRGMTALITAAQFGYADIVRILLEGGADTSLKDESGETAWFKAAVVRHRDVMKLLQSTPATK